MGGLHLDPPSVNTGAGSTFVFVPDNDGAISGQCFMKQNSPLPMSAFHLTDMLPSTLIALPSGEEICTEIGSGLWQQAIVDWMNFVY
jgi:hypothetical protein